MAQIEDNEDALAALVAVVAGKASLTGTETLTNKTLTAPVLNTPTVNAPLGEFLRGHLSGLRLANNSGDATNDIDIAAGSAASDGATPVLMTLAAGLTKRMDAAWAVGTNNGGWLDGTSMPDGTGHAFLIQRSDTGVVDIGVSASLTPTLPTSYDRKRRIGSIIRLSGAIRPFLQDGDNFWLAAPVRDVASTNPGTSAVTYPLSVPVGVNVIAAVNAGGTNGSSNWYGIVSSLDVADAVPTSTSYNCSSYNNTNSANNLHLNQVEVRTNTSGQVRGRISASGASDQFQINTLGWRDSRGREA
ncbi:hypothetical protein [Hoeflea alexandrii]|uniref:Phage tail collar domain-containing protein n=1 Tax=Hoeflea alexandrii TaxID=288436 RepID=A0ABT1CP68_9HYPH|nr:hypothetical protein [Hoeflea alexandrii]MCO6407375.1 hypothetical protein [Hoeflea alexandrii]